MELQWRKIFWGLLLCFISVNVMEIQIPFAIVGLILFYSALDGLVKEGENKFFKTGLALCKVDIGLRAFLILLGTAEAGLWQGVFLCGVQGAEAVVSISLYYLLLTGAGGIFFANQRQEQAVFLLKRVGQMTVSRSIVCTGLLIAAVTRSAGLGIVAWGMDFLMRAWMVTLVFYIGKRWGELRRKTLKAEAVHNPRDAHIWSRL